ncbi:MAG: glycosyltransferase family 4 protein [Alphaproteobacteria bacterium]|nr:glycosyltransferase family 4 protein [Alphaproteobacteria bacterium]
MHLVFIDIIYGYTADRPDTKVSLGGTTSAVCFMAREFMKVGISCTLVNSVEKSGMAYDIPTRPLTALKELCADKSVTAFIFCGRWNAEMVRLMRQQTSAPLIAWMHEGSFTRDAVQPVAEFDGIVFVSEWQSRINECLVSFRWKQTVIPNAINPHFANLFTSDEPVLAAKRRDPPILLFAGDFPRGTFHLIPVLDALRPLDSDFTTEIFTSLIFSPNPETDDEYINILRQQKNVSHVGKVGQTELAQRMKKAAILIAPNPWPETSCINLIQAMAAGLLCVSTDRAALPETANGFARLVPIVDRDHPARFDMQIDHVAFAQSVALALKDWKSDAAAMEAQQRKQVDFFLSHYQWHQRVEPWIEFIKRFG